MIASVFLDDLTAHGLTDDDAARVSEAFETVGRNTDRWPRPVEVIGALPKREETTPGLEHAVTPEQAKQNIALVKQMLRGKVVDLGK